MAIFVPDEGGLAQLQDIYGAADFTLQLLTDSADIADADVVTTHAVASGGGVQKCRRRYNAKVSGGGTPSAGLPGYVANDEAER